MPKDVAPGALHPRPVHACTPPRRRTPARPRPAPAQAESGCALRAISSVFCRLGVQWSTGPRDQPGPSSAGSGAVRGRDSRYHQPSPMPQFGLHRSVRSGRTRHHHLQRLLAAAVPTDGRLVRWEQRGGRSPPGRRSRQVSRSPAVSLRTMVRRADPASRARRARAVERGAPARRAGRAAPYRCRPRRHSPSGSPRESACRGQRRRAVEAGSGRRNHGPDHRRLGGSACGTRATAVVGQSSVVSSCRRWARSSAQFRAQARTVAVSVSVRP